MLAYPSPLLAALLLAAIVLAAAARLAPALEPPALGAFALLGLAAAADLAFTLSALRGRISAHREFADKTTVALSRAGEYALASKARIPVSVQVFEDVLPSMEKHPPAGWTRIGAHGSARCGFTLKALRRGRLELGGFALRISAGLRLWVVQQRFETRQSTDSYPLIEELLRGNLFAHRRRLYSIGQHQSSKFGRGTEFDQLREYSPDDEFRSINWNATARTGKPVVNQYQVEQSRDLVLLLDTGRLMHTDIAGRPRLDRYMDAAVQLAYLALSQRDRVGLMAFDAEVRRYIPPRHSSRHLDNLINSVFDLEPRFVESDYGRAVTTLKQRQPKRGLVVLFTDLQDSVSSRAAVAHLSRIARTHLPLIVILDDPRVAELAQMPLARADDAYAKAAAEKFISEKKIALRTLQTRGCIILNVAAERLNSSLVNQYLAIKARNML